MTKLRNIDINPIRRLKNNFTRERAIEMLKISLIAVILFAFAMIMKDLFSTWYLEQNGSSFYWTLTSGTSGEESVVWYIESYNDASHYYEPYLQAFRFENWNPYSGGSYPKDPLNGYAYGPLFIYSIYFISIFVSLFNPGMERELLITESIKWSHIVFDALTVALLYIVITQLKSFQKRRDINKHAIGILAGVGLTFMPMNLIYVDSRFLNIPQMTFFTLLALILFLKEKYRISALFLTIAWLSKQMTLFIVPIWFLIVWKKKSLKTALVDFIVPFLIATFLFSLPWLVLTPMSYVRRVLGPGKALSTADLSPMYNGVTVSLAHSFKYLEIDFLSNFYLTLNKYQIPFFLFYLIAALMAYFNGKKIGGNETYFGVFTTWLILLTHVFIARGVYKYYGAFFSPFLLLGAVMLLDDYLFDLLNKIIHRDGKSEDNKENSIEKVDVSEEKAADTKETSFIQSIVTTEKFKDLALGFSFILCCGGFYYYTWIIIIKSRHLHPLFLLILFMLVSLLIPQSMYKSLFKKKNYVMIKDDTVYIYKETIKIFKHLFSKRSKEKTMSSELVDKEAK
ncbi:MAG: hypothetical protein KAS95_04620 [Candidatus Heimdallarchaeota archaeon]|nr:hypothetical protein [Candidatus Heimdallarchaeota archaeon]